VLTGFYPSCPYRAHNTEIKPLILPNPSVN